MGHDVIVRERPAAGNIGQGSVVQLSEQLYSPTWQRDSALSSSVAAEASRVPATFAAPVLVLVVVLLPVLLPVRLVLRRLPALPAPKLPGHQPDEELPLREAAPPNVVVC